MYKTPRCILLWNDLYCVGWSVKLFSLQRFDTCASLGFKKASKLPWILKHSVSCFWKWEGLQSLEFSSSQSGARWKRIKSWRRPLECLLFMEELTAIVDQYIDRLWIKGLELALSSRRKSLESCWIIGGGTPSILPEHHAFYIFGMTVFYYGAVVFDKCSCIWFWIMWLFNVIMCKKTSSRDLASDIGYKK